MTILPRTLLPVLLLALALPGGVRAQQAPGGFDLSGFDPSALMGAAGDVVMRASDADIDRLFRAVHGIAQSDAESDALCVLFEPGADRGLPALQRVAGALGVDSRQRFVDALAAVAIGGLQNPPQPFDPEAARQVVKAAGATAMFRHEGFTAGMTATGDDPDSRRMRCQSLRWLVGALDGFPLAERAAATRHLLDEGLALYRD